MQNDVNAFHKNIIAPVKARSSEQLGPVRPFAKTLTARGPQAQFYHSDGIYFGIEYVKSIVNDEWV